MLHFKVSCYLYISTSVDGQDLYLGLLQIHCLICLLLEAKFHSLLLFSLSSLYLFIIHCQEALSLLLAIGGPSVAIPCVQVTRSSAIRPSNDLSAEFPILHERTLPKSGQQLQWPLQLAYILYFCFKILFYTIPYPYSTIMAALVWASGCSTDFLCSIMSHAILTWVDVLVTLKYSVWYKNATHQFKWMFHTVIPRYTLLYCCAHMHSATTCLDHALMIWIVTLRASVRSDLELSSAKVVLLALI